MVKTKSAILKMNPVRRGKQRHLPLSGYGRGDGDAGMYSVLLRLIEFIAGQNAVPNLTYNAITDLGLIQRNQIQSAPLTLI